MHKKLQQKLQPELQQMLDDSVDAGNPGVILELDAPTRGIHESLPSGLFGLRTNQCLSVSDGFRIACMSKIFTGTIVMQLMEEGTQNRVGSNAADLVDAVLTAVLHQ
jgi:CubicO group peptidase (beta-lactamase class C family)